MHLLMCAAMSIMAVLLVALRGDAAGLLFLVPCMLMMGAGGNLPKR